jgi:hypothetical protein
MLFDKQNNLKLQRFGILGGFQKISLKILEFKTGGCAVTGFPFGAFDAPDTQFKSNVGIGQFVRTAKLEVKAHAVVQMVWLERDVLPGKCQVFQTQNASGLGVVCLPVSSFHTFVRQWKTWL